MDLHIIDVASTAGIYAILALGLNAIVGYAGVTSVGHAAFYGVGAYSTAIACVKLGWPPIAAAVVGSLIAGILGALISLPTLRLRDDYLLLATLGFGQVFHLVCRHAEWVTNGPRGIAAIPPLTLFGVSFNESGLLPLLIWTVVLMLAVFFRAVESSPLGLATTAVRDNEVAARSIGLRPLTYKLTALVIGAMSASLAGSLLAHKLSYIDSETAFGLSTSVLVLAMVIFGGRGSIPGVILGAVLLTAFPELLRRAGFPPDVAAPMREILYGMLLIIVVNYRPSGLLGNLRFRG